MTPRPFYATNACDLLETRRHGFAPEGPVHVAMDGGSFDGTTLYLRPEMPLDRMDWRMLVNLEVWLWASPSVPIGRVIETASRIAHARPRELILRFVDSDRTHDIEIGTGTHRPAFPGISEEHAFSWVPLNRCGTNVGRRMRRCLDAKHKPWSVL